MDIVTRFFYRGNIMVRYTYLCVRCCKIRGSESCACGGEIISLGRTQFSVFVAKAVSKSRKHSKNTRKIKAKVIKKIQKLNVYSSNIRYVNEIVTSLQKGRLV